MDMNQAAELLAAANRGEVSNDMQPTMPTPENNPAAPSAPDTPGTAPDAGTTSEEDSFAPGIDPTTLPPELQAIYRGMQSHFTRSQQAIREKEAALDGLNVDEARGALEFINALNTDPQFASAVHQELSQALQSAGMSPQQADAVAANELQSQSESYDDGEQYGSVPPEVLQRLERAEQFMSQQQEQQQRSFYETELNRQEMAIRQGHPEWDDDDIATVYGLAYAHGGDLNAAAEAYVAEQARWATRFLAQKASVPSGQPGVTGHAQTPPAPMHNLDQATQAAEEIFRNSFNG
jgi:hypothetical protein